jgi:hypothetical protein
VSIRFPNAGSSMARRCMMRMGMRRLTVTGKRVSAKLSKLDMKQALIQGAQTADEPHHFGGVRFFFGDCLEGVCDSLLEGLV